ncbi:hypothetical protein QTQ03_16640 [Micromonospora sp. WMMA1363]|uniref:terminase small subunit n=1 Tax=Micromonospora sp. WMMA1363 TaxID=3053985 RepID=UPI00259C8663|nr:hypothetical protein [Micromonospora sp. WMMA1363]MDM4721147.1 hypothetical protein [Micromonospora sp. WMMA1363]
MDTAAGPLEQSVRDALAARPVTEVDQRDTATAELALTYARDIDNGAAELSKIGPPLLAALEALRLSPRARATGKGAKSDEPGNAGRLDELRARRARKSRTTPVDTAAGGADA